MRAPTWLKRSAALAMLMTATACSEPDISQVGGSGGSGSGNGGSGSGTGGSGTGGTGASGTGGAGGFGIPPGGGAGGNQGGNGSGGATGTKPGNGMRELCDGMDNDANGIVDDVDQGGDGICDCLRIATLGKAGRWGQGNVFSSWLQARSTNGATDLGDAVITPEKLAGLQVLVIQDVSVVGRTYAASEVKALEDWVRAGGGVMTLIGYAEPDERANVNLLLGPSGISYGAQQILQKNGGRTIPVRTWSAHPVSMGVQQIGVDNGYPVTGEGTVVAREGGHDMLRARELGSGRVLVWGDEWITYDSEWNARMEYQVELFWVNAIKWLTPPKQCQVAIPPRLIP